MFPGMVISALLVALMLRSGGSRANAQQSDKQANKQANKQEKKSNASAEVVATNGDYIVIRKATAKG